MFISNDPISKKADASLIEKIKSKATAFCHKYEKYEGITVFSAGFLWDALTLNRVDNMLDNLILLFYLFVIAVMIILTLRQQCGAVHPRWIQKIEARFLWAMQFCFGGLFSSYVIFYFKSASWTRTQLFFLMLVCLFVGNEFLQQRMKNRKLLAVLYCFCLFSFLTFFLPVIFAAVGMWMFLLAGFASLTISFAVFGIGFRANRDNWRRNMISIVPFICSVWLAVNALYFFNLIPPVPLALKDSGIYHKVVHRNNAYEVQYVPPPFYRFWRTWDNPFYYSKGDRVYCYTAIFAPNKVHVPLVHVWSYKTSKGWKRTRPINLAISGGRDGGWRTYSYKNNVQPGEWRVEVQTDRGQTLGRIAFSLIPADEPHQLETKLLE